MTIIKYEEKYDELFTEFNRYIIEHPEFAKRIPRDALIVLLDKNDPAFSRENLRRVKGYQKHDDRRDRPVVYVQVGRLAPSNAGFGIRGITNQRIMRSTIPERIFICMEAKMGMAIIVHGGSGDIKEVDAYRRGVEIAAQIGWDILRDRGRAMDAVQTAIVSMEDDPAFDAGFGSFLNREGEVEMDASVMEGRTLDAGAVAGVKRIKNPIVLARRVLQSEHTFLIADGAEQFAQENGIALVTNESMRAPAQIAQWREWKINPPPAPIPISRGTVGCVALDRDGNIAAGTSTGGTKFKRAGRVGDSPLIGCGTFADNGLGGASATGWGEAITRVVLAKFAVDALANDRDPKLAAQIAIDHLAHRVGGTGGIILADRSGRVGFAFNTPRMARAFIHDGLRSIVADC